MDLWDTKGKKRVIKKAFYLLSLFLSLFLLFTYLPGLLSSLSHKVTVIDGDTIAIAARKIRYIGIDAPEWDEPFFEEAKRRNKEILSGKRVRIETCKEEPYDRYGRTLAWVYADGTLVNAQLLREGLAMALIIPPCGKKREKMLLELQKGARRKGLGLWSMKRKAISHNEAHRHIGEYRAVKGRVLSTYNSGKAVFLNFGPDYRTDFTVVILARHLRDFHRLGIVPESYYRGKKVIVIGRIEEYNGPEIVVKNPSQIWVER